MLYSFLGLVAYCDDEVGAGSEQRRVSQRYDDLPSYGDPVLLPVADKIRDYYKLDNHLRAIPPVALVGALLAGSNSEVSGFAAAPEGGISARVQRVLLVFNGDGRAVALLSDKQFSFWLEARHGSGGDWLVAFCHYFNYNYNEGGHGAAWDEN